MCGYHDFTSLALVLTHSAVAAARGKAGAEAERNGAIKTETPYIHHTAVQGPACRRYRTSWHGELRKIVNTHTSGAASRGRPIPRMLQHANDHTATPTRGVPIPLNETNTPPSSTDGSVDNSRWPERAGHINANFVRQ